MCGRKRTTRVDRKPRAVVTDLAKHLFPSLIALLFIVSACEQRPAHQARSTRVSPPDILKWVEVDVDVVAVLTHEPAECLPRIDGQSLPENIVMGRAAFRSPYFLGGQAARRGMSCNTCHTNGHVNVNFYIEGLSGEAGTADVTNFHFSTTLGDNVFNPKPIPSLRESKIPHSEAALRAQEKFILRLVEQEFDGAPPSQMIKTAAIEYVRSLNVEKCSQASLTQRGMLDFRVRIVSQELGVLSALTGEDPQNADFLRLSLRAELGRLYDRFPLSKQIRNELVNLSNELKPDSKIAMSKINSRWVKLKKMLEKEFENSLFSTSFTASWFAN